MPHEASAPDDVNDGDHVRVTGGTHAGRSGTVEDRKTSKTGHVTITVREAGPQYDGLKPATNVGLIVKTGD